MMMQRFFLIGLLAVTGLAAKEKKKEAAGPVYGPVVVTEREKGIYSAKVDFTYWVGQAQGLLYSQVASTAENVMIPKATTTAQPGFRAELGFGIPQMKADLGIEYTFFYNEGDKNKYSYYTASGTDAYLGGYQKVGGSIASNFNSVSGYMKKKYIFDQGIILEPLGGMIYAASRQWFTRVSQDPLTSDISVLKTISSATLNGFGPMGGFNVRFFPAESLTKSLRIGLLADSGAALCYNLSSTNKRTYHDDVAQGRVFRRDRELVPMLKGALGLIAEYFGKGDKPWSIAGVLKWDTQAWLTYVFLLPNSEAANAQTFTMQGVSLGIEGTF